MWEAIAGSVIGSALNNWFADERQDDAQSFAAEQQMNAQIYNSAQAAENRNFQERMSSTANQRAVADLNAAGLNPMLAFRSGGASSPAGGQGSVGPASAGIASPGNNFDFPAAMHTSAQIELQKAQTEKTQADTDVSKATAEEIRQRTPTHAVSIDQMNQNIEESRNRINKIIQETSTSSFSAANIAQQTKNLEELIPQIRATVDQLRAHTKLTTSQTTLTGAQTTLAGAHTGQAAAQTGLAKAETVKVGEETKHIGQQVSANLPALEAALKRLENVSKQMALPRQAQDEIVHDSFLGSLGATLRALNPLQGFMR